MASPATPLSSLSRGELLGHPAIRARMETGLILALAAAGGAIAASGHRAPFELVPAAIVGAIACNRWPVASVVTVFLFSGFALTAQVYLHLPPAGLSDLLLGGLWAGVLWSCVRNDPRRPPLWLWPPLFLAALYLLLTFAAMLASSDVGTAFQSVRLAGWHMAAIFLIALAPWSARTLDRIVRGIVLVALVAGLYAVFRQVTGPGARELVFVLRSFHGMQPPGKLFASFYSPQDLGGWFGCVTPFCLALALVWTGRWRAAAAAATAVGMFAILASDRRAATAGVVGGLLVVLVLYLAGRRPFGGRRLAVGFVGFLVSAMLAAGFYSLTIARSPESVARFEALLGGTSTDHDYQVRLIRWKHAWRLAAQEPLGHGLGTVGEVAGRQRNRFQIAPYLDSSYLKIALEQGIPLMVLFAAALVVLLLGLAWRGVNTPDPITGAIAIGACGTIVAMATVFYSSMYIERIAALGGWLIVGVAAAQFTRPRGRERRPQKLRSAAPTRAPRGMPRVSPRLGAPS